MGCKLQGYFLLYDALQPMGGVMNVELPYKK